MAGKEYSIESALDKMAAEWEGAPLQLLEYRATGTFVIKLDEALLQQLDDHIGEPLLQAHMPAPWLPCSPAATDNLAACLHAAIVEKRHLDTLSDTGCMGAAACQNQLSCTSCCSMSCPCCPHTVSCL